MNHSPSLPTDFSAFCQIDSCATVSAHLSEVQALAREKHAYGSYSLPTRFLRHADEQTVIGVRSILKAMAADTQGNSDISNDAVIAATCLAGQPAAARTMIGLRDKGPVAVTPHIVPQCSLHSVASAASVGFGMHGPNFGVGGGIHAVSEGLLLAVTLAPLLAITSPSARIWLICTGWDQQPSLKPNGEVDNDPLCRGLTLLLKHTPSHSIDNARPQIRITSQQDSYSRGHYPADTPLKELYERLENGIRTTVAITNICVIEITPPELSPKVHNVNETVFRKEAP